MLYCIIVDYRQVLLSIVQYIDGIGSTTITKLANNENVTMKVMVKICGTLDCEIDGVVEILPNEK